MENADAHIWRTSIAEWPDALCDLCLPFQQIGLSTDDRDALIALSGGRVAGRNPWEVLTLSGEFIDDLDDTLRSYSGGAHARFDLCSLKLGAAPPKIRTSGDFISALKRENPRVLSALASFAHAGRDAHVFLFPWRDMPPWTEFRLFIRDREVVGVSQYHHGRSYPEIEENLEAVKASLRSFSRKLIGALHMDTVVADAFVSPQGDGSFATTLIELNPFVMRTDPCLYSWRNGGDFDGYIRYR